MKRSEIKRKPAKRRERGTACAFGRRCLAVGEHNGQRVCAKHWADILYSEHIRSAGECWAAGREVECKGRLQCCHIFSRRYSAIRWADNTVGLGSHKNAVAMCAAHHLYYTLRPAEWEQVCRDKGIEWDKLRWEALNLASMDAMKVVERLLDR